MKEPAVHTGWAAARAALEGWGSSTGLGGFIPGLSSTVCRRSSFPQGITHAGLALPQATCALPGQHPACLGAMVGSWGGSSLLDTLPCFPWASSSLMCQSCFLDTHGCSETLLEPKGVGFSFSLLWAPEIPACPFPFLLARCGMSSWPGQRRRGLRAACGTTAPPS